MNIRKQNLLIIACLVWAIAGFNILKIGISSYIGYVNIINIITSLIIFSLFWFLVFSKLTSKHTLRIISYDEEYQFFLKFFDKKSFMIMAFMMSFGICIRTFKLMPLKFIAVFYTGLGSALFLAGAVFGLNYINHIRKKEEL
ncbi:hypothetical protein EXD82_01165 [Peptacetobacter hominis]|uniref:Uncharacterized protein n=1 Tax=Peptacetobacter hominis TaxID=2743610 RepID=A0A544QYT4_9FIRM|nr:hypothetical protein [Peptacetobacter hominis]TQQ85852.1 hypothetical protein EXD82_01165 [Peptacetobacter hominis]